MAFKLVWSSTARLDLWDLLSYISESDRQAAAEFGRSVFAAIERLREFPESGRIVPELSDPAIREIIRRPCRIVYRVRREEKLVEIARIWHAARGIPEM
ncbi:MAG TPA: type II toxin-antitoxin system RelE/ParE family toxin [Candidatus Hydrogenedentes bacterium]|nr:type II toxin-antitoxin system RelE/ParE family toxin [Candidatus Hydrogenedentota bacterium]HIJ73721.1 type II toxin-antitoxin system RelE/ParE family toxin [Candidatus Hydrogenedentota bacterium]